MKRKLTQKEKVLAYLKMHGKITSLDAMSKLFILDLQGVIRDLIASGVKIKSVWANSKDAKYKIYYK